VDRDSVAARFDDGQNGVASPDGYDNGLVPLRRQSDWTGQRRPDDDAAASAYRAALDVATATLAAYDGGTASHSDDVVTLCLALAEELGVRDRERAYLLAAAELHDIGKVAVAPEILSKPAALDSDEWKVVREHTVTGERILGAVPELAEVARIVRHCHERWDGGGYPDGLAGERIPLGARIVFCADAFHAIRGDRPYRRGRSARAALAEVQQHAGTQFDPAVVTALAAVAARLGERRRRGLTVIMGGRRSQRLAALLLTLAIGGGALAATGVWGPPKGKASTESEHREKPAHPSGGAEPRAAGAARDASSAPASRDAFRAPARMKARAASEAPAATGGSRRGELDAMVAPKPGGQGLSRPEQGDEPGRAAPRRQRGRAAPRRQRGRAAPRRHPANRPTLTPAPAPRGPTRPVTPAPAPLPPADGGDEGGDDDEGNDNDPDDDYGGGGHSGPGKGGGNGYGHDKGKGGHRGHDD